MLSSYHPNTDMGMSMSNTLCHCTHHQIHPKWGDSAGEHGLYHLWDMPCIPVSTSRLAHSVGYTGEQHKSITHYVHPNPGVKSPEYGQILIFQYSPNTDIHIHLTHIVYPPNLYSTYYTHIPPTIPDTPYMGGMVVSGGWVDSQWWILGVMRQHVR